MLLQVEMIDGLGKFGAYLANEAKVSASDVVVGKGLQQRALGLPQHQHVPVQSSVRVSRRTGPISELGLVAQVGWLLGRETHL